MGANVRLPEVDRTKLHESYRMHDEARELRKQADQLEHDSKRLHREHYAEQYDRCRACDGRGTVGEGLLSHSCSYCNCGLLPKGTYAT